MRIPTMADVRRLLKRKREERRFARMKRDYRRARPGPDRARPAFVVGCQRSGTTMLGRVLARMFEVDYYHESDRRAFDNFRLRETAVLNRIIDASGAACVVFKPICDSHRVLEMLAEHPGGRALWIYRRWQDVVNSAVRIWPEHLQQVVGDLAAGRGSWGWRHEGLTPACLAEVRRLHRPELPADDCIALFWLYRNRIYFDQQLDRREDVLPVCYEALVERPVDEFQRICRFLEIPYTPEAVEMVHARSIAKNPCAVRDPAIIEACDALYQRLNAAWSARRAADEAMVEASA